MPEDYGMLILFTLLLRLDLAWGLSSITTQWSLRVRREVRLMKWDLGTIVSRTDL